MPFVRFAHEAALYDATSIENRFLMDYLPTAPEGTLKVYLALRMLALHPELGDRFADLPTLLRMEEAAVENALTYWEREGLLQRTSDVDQTYQLLPYHVSAAHTEPNEQRFYEMRDFTGSVQQLFDMSKGPEFIVQPKFYGMVDDWLHTFHMSQDAVLYLLAEELKKGSKRPGAVIARLDKKISAWAKDKKPFQSKEDVERLMITEGYAAAVAGRVLKQLSIARKPSVDEIRLADKWLREWSLTEAEIIGACTDTTKSRNPSMAYLDSILNSRRSGTDGAFACTKSVLSELGMMDAKPTPDQLSRVSSFLEDGFEPETLRLVAVQCTRLKKRHFEEFVRMTGKWKEDALFKVADAEAFIRTYEQQNAEVRRLLDLAGSTRTPTQGDRNLYLGWKEQYNAPLIDFAATCAVGLQQPMRYIDKVLKEWGNISPEEARARHEQYKRESRSVADAPANPALNYAKRPESDSDFESLFVDLNRGSSD